MYLKLKGLDVSRHSIPEWMRHPPYKDYYQSSIPPVRGAQITTPCTPYDYPTCKASFSEHRALAG